MGNAEQSLRRLPQVQRLLESPSAQELVARYGRPALVEVINELSIQLSVEIKGPQNATFILPGNEVRRYCLLPGDYTFVARAAGYNPLTGDKTFDSGGCQCWWFYSGIRVHPLCNCDNDATHYGPLP